MLTIVPLQIQDFENARSVVSVMKLYISFQFARSPLSLKIKVGKKREKKKEKEKRQKRNYCVESIRKLKSNIFHAIKVV